jgi:hypothetical protein
MMIGDLAVAMVFFHALGTMNLLGTEILAAVEGQQVITIQKAKLFQGLAVGQSREDISEGGPELFVVDRIEDFSHASVTRHVFHAEDHLQVFLVLLSPLVERQHGRLLESEHGEPAHQRVRQADIGFPGPGIRDVLEGLMDVPQQGIGGKLFATGPCLGHNHTPFCQTDRLQVCMSDYGKKSATLRRQLVCLLNCLKFFGVFDLFTAGRL